MRIRANQPTSIKQTITPMAQLCSLDRVQRAKVVIRVTRRDLLSVNSKHFENIPIALAIGGSSHKTLYMSQQERMHEIGKVYNYQGEQANGSGNTSAANIKIQNQRKNQQVSQSLTRAQIKDATKRSATGGTGNMTTPNTGQLQTI